MLTNDGDIVRRNAGVVQRLGGHTQPGYLTSNPAGVYPVWQNASAPEGEYFRSRGNGVFALFEHLALSDTGIHFGDDVCNSTEVITVTGVPFRPSIVIILAVDQPNANQNWSVGFAISGAINCCLSNFENGTETEILNNLCIRIRRAVGNRLYGSISGTTADGFTLGMTLVGACALDFSYICLP